LPAGVPVVVPAVEPAGVNVPAIGVSTMSSLSLIGAVSSSQDHEKRLISDKNKHILNVYFFKKKWGVISIVNAPSDKKWILF
jgi:hypothetical protein